VSAALDGLDRMTTGRARAGLRAAVALAWSGAWHWLPRACWSWQQVGREWSERSARIGW